MCDVIKSFPLNLVNSLDPLFNFLDNGINKTLEKPTAWEHYSRASKIKMWRRQDSCWVSCLHTDQPSYVHLEALYSTVSIRIWCLGQDPHLSEIYVWLRNGRMQRAKPGLHSEQHRMVILPLWSWVNSINPVSLKFLTWEMGWQFLLCMFMYGNWK